MTAPTPTPNSMPGAAPAVPAPDGHGQQPPVAPTAPTPMPPAAQTPPAVAPEKPPWEKSGEPFDPERAWNLIQNKTKDLADLKAKTDPIVSEWEQLRRASQSDNERMAEDLTAAAKREETWRGQAIQAKAEAMVAGRFIDAETALALIGDVSQYVTGDAIDVPKLTAKLDQLAVDKPFLLALPTQPPGFTPNRAQSQAGTGVSLEAQIQAAQAAGNVRQSIALKQQQHAALRQQK